MLRGRSDADTSSNLKPRFCFRGEAFLKEKGRRLSGWEEEMGTVNGILI